MECFAEIRPIIAKELSVDEDAVTPEASLQDDLDADSLAILNISESLSRRYRITLQYDDLIELENVGELVALVESRLAAS